MSDARWGGESTPGRHAFNIEVSGYERPGGEWVNAEDPEGNIIHHARPGTLEVSPQIVVRWDDEDDETHYRTTSHLTSDFDVRAWLEQNYNIEFT